MYQKYFVKLTNEERLHLEKLISCGTAPARQLTRARILLKSDCNEGAPNWTIEAISETFDVNPTTVAIVRKRYKEGGMEKVLHRKKPNREYARRLDGYAEAHLIAMVCSDAPEGYGRWTLRLLRDRFVKLEIVESVSHETIRAMLKKTNLSLG